MNAKITLAATLLAVTLISVLAKGQDQPPAPSTTSTPTQEVAHQVPAGTGTQMAQFCARLREPVRYYPEHARDLHIEGVATLECALDPAGHVQTCWIISETPPHEEFGLAGQRIMCRVINSPAPSSWSRFHVDGDTRPHIRAPLNFRLNGAN
jgi:TonB family protein